VGLVFAVGAAPAWAPRKYNKTAGRPFSTLWVPHTFRALCEKGGRKELQRQLHAQSTLGLTLSDIVANERVPHPYRRFLAIGWVPSTIPYCPIRETLRHARPYYTCMSSPSRAFAYCLSLVASR